MNDFPEFMKNRSTELQQGIRQLPASRATSSTGRMEAKWRSGRASQTASSDAHVHDFDEYMVVVQGCYTLIIDGQRIPVEAGQEYFIPRSTPHAGEVVAGTRTIHAFGGQRADRVRS